MVILCAAHEKFYGNTPFAVLGDYYMSNPQARVGVAPGSPHKGMDD
jgi:hypothetical protein